MIYNAWRNKLCTVSVCHAFSSLHKCMQQLLHTSLSAVLDGPGGGGGPLHIPGVSHSEVEDNTRHYNNYILQITCWYITNNALKVYAL